MEVYTSTSWHGSGDKIDISSINADYGGREFNCVDGDCAVLFASHLENRPCSSDMALILPLLPLDPQE